MRKLIAMAAGAAAGLAMMAQAFAADFGNAPADYELLASDYIESRLENPRGARIAATSEPYQVYASIGGYEGVPAWAVDMRVRARLKSRQVGGSMAYTVVFIDGDPIALEEDEVRLTRL